LQILAGLIDADNAQAAIIEGLLAEIARFGEATVKRIYGDFTSPRSASWNKVLQKHAIKPVQQYAYTTGKNATDSALIIDAMDLLYTRKFDGFCLVTSDSDFTGFPRKFMLDALELSGDDAGWAHLGTFGSYLTKIQPDFDSRLYGFKKLSDLVRAKTDIFSTEERVPAGQTQKVLYVRAK